MCNFSLNEELLSCFVELLFCVWLQYLNGKPYGPHAVLALHHLAAASSY